MLSKEPQGATKAKWENQVWHALMQHVSKIEAWVKFQKIRCLRVLKM